MNPDIKAKWVAALRSGTFVQGKEHLKRESTGGATFCCLGVLCEVAGVALIKSITDYYTEDNPMSAYLGVKAMKAIGLSPAEQDTLARMNDEGTPFSVIADYIEVNL